MLYSLQFTETKGVDELSYKIATSKLVAKIGDNIVKTNKFQFRNTTFPEKTTVQVTANIQGIGVTGNYTINQLTRTYVYSFNIFQLLVPKFLEKTYDLTYSVYKSWEIQSFNRGFYFELYPYVYPHYTTWQFFDNLRDSLENTYDQYKTQGYEVDYAFHTNSDENYYSFESWTGGEINGEYGDISANPYHIPANVSYDNLFKIVINKHTGIVSGFRMKGRVNGLLNGTKVDVQLDYQYTKSGSSMRNFVIGPSFTVAPFFWRNVGISTIIILTVITTSILTTFLVKRKKKNL